MRSLRIGTRGSRLALAQARWTRDALSRARPDMEIELLAIRTTGDVIRDVPLRPEHGSSFFTKEIEDALLEGRIDLAVHSCKDLATRLPDGLSIAAFPPRVDARDVLVSPHGGLADIPAGSTVGTSSMRRRGFLLEVRPDLEVVPIRGNVPTRIAAADNGRVGAVVLAAAGLIRLGLEDRISSFFPEDHMLPAAGQGALALQVREGDEESSEVVRALDDEATRSAVEAERACLRALEAGCQSPVGAWARIEGGRLVIDAAILSPDATVRARESGPASNGEALGIRVAGSILSQLGVASLRDVTWAGPPPRAGGA